MGVRWLALAPLLCAAAAVADEDAGKLDRLVEEMAAKPPERAAMDLYARAFAGYALVSRGLAAKDERAHAVEQLDRLITQVLDPRSGAVFHAGFVEAGGRTLSASVAYRGHLALLLVGRALLSPLPPGRRALLDQLAAGIARDLEAAPTHLLPSYEKRIWPADNEVAAAALALYRDRLGGDTSVDGGRRALEESLAALEAKGLPPSEIRHDRLVGRDVPRGCALSWSVAMRALHDPAGARRLYDRYRERFFVDYGPVVGFREWPRGLSRAGDADSGPIVLGIGVAASGIGLGAARLAGATVDEARLAGSSVAAGLPVVETTRGRLTWTPRAMALWGRAARPW